MTGLDRATDRWIRERIFLSKTDNTVRSSLDIFILVASDRK